MDTNRNFRRLSMYIGMFATIDAGLVGLGQGSWNLPMVVGICALVSLIYTDILGWFSLHRSLVYVGMIGGATVAIAEFFRNSGADPLQSVGNMLVYVQIPLMFQKKTKRVFEQIGVFLMLELVVAALINDNVLYGVLMLPILGIGSAALTALAQYASHLRHNESVSESTGFVSRWMHWLGVEHMRSTRASGVNLSAVSPSMTKLSSATEPTIVKWRSGIMPTAFAVFVFSVSYFYMVPRLHSGAYELAGWGSASIGFSDKISLRHIGDLLQSDLPVFRMSMRDNKARANYRPNQPPYIRATVVHQYESGAGNGEWIPAETFLMHTGVFGDMPTTPELMHDVTTEADDVTVSIIEKSNLGPVVPAMPPFSKSMQQDKDLGFNVCWRDWRLVDGRELIQRTAIKRRYAYRTFSFTNGQDSAILPEMNDCYGDTPRKHYPLGEVLEFPQNLELILPFRDEVFAKNPSMPSDVLSKAIYLEDYFANSTDFKYTLHLTAPVDKTIDPIADFLLNKRAGHCQYFASSLVLLLRSMQIPARLVVGFRPGEYNEVGQYFLVQQKHTHTWVEAYFTRKQFEAKSISLPSYVTHGAWLRLDPTPPGEGSNAGGTFRAASGQTLDVMQDLWNEMVMNRDKTRHGGIMSLFGESSGESYANYWLQLQSAIAQMQSSRFIGGLLSPERWFSWRVALGVIVIGLILSVLYQLIRAFFPGLLPRWGRARNRSHARVSKIDFYNRAVKALKRFGVQRDPWQTQREFFVQASQHLATLSIPFDPELISKVFYEIRFGGMVIPEPHEHEKIEKQLKALETGARERAWLLR